MTGKRLIHGADGVIRTVDAPTPPPKPAPGAFDGSVLWAELHRRPWSMGAPEQELAWLAAFVARLPCGECRGHWLAWTAENPPDLSTAESYFVWTWRGHQAVNAKLNRPGLSLAEALARWRLA